MDDIIQKFKYILFYCTILGLQIRRPSDSQVFLFCPSSLSVEWLESPKVVTCRATIGDMLSPVQTLLKRHDIPHPYECTFGLAHLSIDKGVFCPTFTNVSPLLLSVIDFRSGERVLDAFAGSGAFGVNAALHGATVVAFDNSKLAVDCVRSNAVRNNVAECIEARLGTLKEAIALDEKFDLIIANPPLLPGTPKDELEAAVYDPDLRATVELVELLPAHLTKAGRCYLLTSDVFDRHGHDLNELCRKNHLTMEIVSQADFGYETYRVHRIALI